MGNTYEEWASETETWSEASMPGEREMGLTFVHSKTVNNVPFDFFQDSDGNWFRCVSSQ